MSVVTFLPYDIVHTLSRWLDKPSLIALSMVSKYFYLATVNIIWANVTLSYSGGSWGRFESIITTLSHSPRLTKYLESLQIEILEPFIPSGPRADTSRRVSGTIRVLQLSTGLKKLRLYLHRDRRFGRRFYKKLARANFGFELEECVIPGSYTPPRREFMRFLQPMTSLKRLTMFGIRDQEYGWLNYRPNPNDWPFLESIHFSDIESVTPFIPGRPIQSITVWELRSDSPKLRTLVTKPVETMRMFKMLSWESDHSPQGAHALAEYLSDLHVAFPRISTLMIGYWYSSQIDDDGSELLPPMFTQATFRALGEFEELQTLVCPIWALEGESETETYRAEPLLSNLRTHCPLLGEVFLRRNLFTPPRGPEVYENWVQVISSDCSMESIWEEKEWDSQEALAKHVGSL